MTLGLVALGLMTLGAAQAQSVLTVAFMGPLSGSLKALGEEKRNGALLALTQAGDRFNKLGYGLRLQSFDDEATVDVGFLQAQRILALPEVLMLVGPINSNVTQTVSAFFSKAHLGIVTMSTSAQITEAGLLNVNRMVSRDDAQGPAAADFIAGQLGAKTAYLVDDGTPLGKDSLESVEKRLAKKGVKVLGKLSLNLYSDFKLALEPLVKAKPDVVYFSGFYDVATGLLKRMREAKLSSVLVGTDGLDNPAFTRELKTLAEGVYYTNVVAPPAAYPRAGAFINAYRAKFGHDPSSYSVMGYDSMTVALSALEDATVRAGGKPTREQVERALRTVKLGETQTLTGEVRFNAKGDRLKTSVYILKIGSDLLRRVSLSMGVTPP